MENLCKAKRNGLFIGRIKPMSTCCFCKGKISLIVLMALSKGYSLNGDVYFFFVRSDLTLQQHLCSKQLKGLLKLQCQTLSCILTSCQLTAQKNPKSVFVIHVFVKNKVTRAVSQSCPSSHTWGKCKVFI